MLALAAPVFVACLAACNRARDIPASGALEADAAVTSTTAAVTDAEAPATGPATATPPPPVVAADPNIPLNEAVVGPASPPPDYGSDVAPPAPVVEDQPPPPDADDVWVPGYWWWSAPLERYVWVGGAWRDPPPDQVWYPGSWQMVGAHYVWQPGCWAPLGFGREYVAFGPPPLREEIVGVGPGAGFVWTPGYFAWSGGEYGWVGGSWARPPQLGLSWVAPAYVSVGGRFSLQPGRWDFAADRRGTVYRPDLQARAGAHIALTAVPASVVSAHVAFQTAAANIVAHGGERTASGAFVRRNPGASEHALSPTQASPATPRAMEPAARNAKIAPVTPNEQAPHAATPEPRVRHEQTPERATPSPGAKHAEPAEHAPAVEHEATTLPVRAATPETREARPPVNKTETRPAEREPQEEARPESKHAAQAEEKRAAPSHGAAVPEGHAPLRPVVHPAPAATQKAPVAAPRREEKK